ncbi:MAG: hypothetical protein H7196_05025 [candidate division SR1 bacterium]|nr:hypothetical protein [candidate division SR1 bacterium]
MENKNKITKSITLFAVGILLFGTGSTIGWYLHKSDVTKEAAKSSQDSKSETVSETNKTDFLFCRSSCGSALYYVGYNRDGNIAAIGDKKSSFVKAEDTIYKQTSDVRLKEDKISVNEQRVDNEDGNFVTSTHRIEDVKIGFVRKSESLNINTILPQSYAKANVRMFWGDTLSVTSKTLAKGTPVSLQINRSVGGFGNPVTKFAYYKVQTETLVNKTNIKDLAYGVTKNAGVDEYTENGKTESSHVITTKVGDVIKLESQLTVEDGVNSDNMPQFLDGADSVKQSISILTPEADYILASGSTLK